MPDKHVKKESKDSVDIPVGKTFSKIRENPWIVATVVLAIVLIGVLIYFGVNGLSGSGKEISSNDATKLVTDFLSSQVQGAQVTDVQKVSGLYALSVVAGTQKGTVYTTLDGKYIGSMNLISAVNNAAAGNTADANSGQKVSISLGNAPVTGNASAKVNVVEFSDFSCPFCAAASGDNAEMVAYMKQNSPTWEPIVTNLMSDYVATGQVRFAVKYSYGHTGGHSANLVFWCLNDQSSDLAFKFYPKAYASNPQSDVENLTNMEAIAKSIGANMNTLNQCITSKKYDGRFDTEQAEGTAAGVQGTPAFFVGNDASGYTLISGAQPFSVMKQVVDAALASA